MSIDNLKFSIGWKPEYYEKLRQLLSKELKKTLLEKMNDITYFPKPDYDAMKESNEDLFNRSILRYPSTNYKVDDVYGDYAVNEKIISLKRQYPSSSD